MIRNVLQRLQLDFRIKVGYGAAFILLLVSYIVTWYANGELITQSRLVMHSDTVINQTEELSSYMKDAETGLRGYVVLKDESFLEPYNKSRNAIDSTFKLLKKETADNTSQQILLYAVKKFIDEKYNIMDFAKNYYPQHDFKVNDSLLKRTTYTGKILMDSIRNEIGIMKNKEQELLDSRSTELNKRYVSMNIIIVTSLVLAFLFAGLGLITYLRENKARKIADEKVLEYQNQLRQRIEELDTANKELIQMRRTEKFAATGRIARTIAHEVRNPLTNIDLAIGQLKSEVTGMDESSAMLFDMINRNSKRINQLITELLNTTRFVDLRFEAVSINGLLDDALELAKDRLLLNHIFIEKKYGEDICAVLVDAEKIKIVFLNVIVNAVEAMESNPNGILKIVTKDEDNKCVIEISDNGVGMDAAALSKLFEPYFTTKTNGNGLGLANTQNIILNHKGIINVESTPGKGTTFIIKFDFAPVSKVPVATVS
jgi:signal transduction histidine kinase